MDTEPRKLLSSPGKRWWWPGPASGPVGHVSDWVQDEEVGLMPQWMAFEGEPDAGFELLVGSQCADG